MIYCVEDDDSIRELELYALRGAGFSGRGFAEGKCFWTAMQEQKPSLILLDIMLPGEDGISILKKLKNNTATVEIPVIMTTAKGTEYDKVLGLDSGADDYLAKPFGMMEMISRVKAVLRRVRSGEKSVAQIVQVEGIVLDVQKHTVSVDGEHVDFTKREFDLLKLFLTSAGQVFTRDSLLNSIWQHDYIGETRTVDMHISSIRTKLGRYGTMIGTVRGVGYRLDTVEEKDKMW